MKRIIAFAILLAIAINSVIAQTGEPSVKKFYLEGGGGPANHNGVFAEVGAHAVLKNNWMASLSYYTFDMDPQNLPSDYQPGYTILFVIPIPNEMPSVNMTMFNIAGGKLFQVGRKTWVTAEAGVSIASGDKMSFTHQQVEYNGLYQSSNYATQKESQTTIGGVLKTDFTWAFTPYVGLSVGAFANINSIQSPVGAEFKLIAGWLNTKKKSKK
jgi:hypothetical protein